MFIAAADWDKATAAMAAGLAPTAAAATRFRPSWYTAHLGWLARLRGRDDEAVSLGRQALAMTETLKHTWWESAACAMLGTTLLQGGDRTEAVGLLERGLAAAEQSGVEAYLLRCAAPLAAATPRRPSWPTRTGC